MNIIIIINHPYQNQAGIFSLENIVLRFNNYMTVCNQNAHDFVNTRWERTMLPCDDCYYYYYYFVFWCRLWGDIQIVVL